MRKSLTLVLTTYLLLFAVPLFAQYDDNFQGETPYFKVKSTNGKCSELPLKSVKADVDISGVIANVKLTQTFVNKCDQTIEADYVFPGSSQSAVYDMVMKIGDREIRAKVKEREQAKKAFDKAKKEGKTAALLQQQRPNVFQMGVGNILPGDLIQVEIYYTETIIPEDAIYEFHLPLKVGERYANGEHYKKDSWVSNPFTSNSKNNPSSKHTFELDLTLNAGMPIKEVQSMHYKTQKKYRSKAEIEMKLSEGKVTSPKDDFILRYRLSGNKINGGILLYPGEDENYFMLTVQPPQRPKPEDIPPRSYQFIIDVSGSMSGFPLDVSKELMGNLLKNLRKTDKFNILLFAGSNQMIFDSPQTATSKNVKQAMKILNSYSGNGGTEMLPAIKNAMNAVPEKGESSTFVIVTDGFVTIEKEAFDYVKKNLGKANFFTFGIGKNVNRYLIEGLAHCGKGAPIIVYNQDEAKEKADQLIKYIQSPVFTDIQMITEDFDIYDIDTEEIPDLFAEKPIVISGKYKGDPQGKFTFLGLSGKHETSITVPVNINRASPTNEAVKFLWARNRIRELADYNKLSRNDPNAKEITRLGLKYNLLTEFTSFIAIDDQVREIAVKNTGAAPEPHEWLLIIFAAFAILFIGFYYFK